MINEIVFSVRKDSTGPESNRFRALQEILVTLAPLLILGLIGTSIGLETLLGGMIVTLAYVVTIALATSLLARRGSGWREIGLARPKSWLRTMLLGIGAVFASVIVTTIVQNVTSLLVQMAPADVTRFNPLEGDLPRLILYVTLAWTTIAFGEEMFFRAFLIDRLAQLFQGTKARWTLAVLGSTIAFGAAHFAEGPAGLLTNGFFGLVLALIYLRTGRNLWVTIIAHGLINTLRFVLVYSGAA